MLYDLIIHDHRDKLNRNINVTMADSGRMDIDDKNGLIKLILYSGVTYDEKVALGNARLTERDRQMYRHDEFSEQIVQVKVDGLDFSRTDENAFKTNDRMKNLGQLRHDGDSLIRICDSLTSQLARQTATYTLRKTRYKYKTDSAYTAAIDTMNVIGVDSLSSTLTLAQLNTAMGNALRQAKNNKQFVDERRLQFEVEHTKVNRHQMEQHRKFTMPVACLLFFFIGAPLGAIIRKGGLGTPVVISVLFFIFYYVIDTFGAKCAREDVWPVPCGMWLSTAILASIGAFLTYKSATDSALFKSEAYGRIADKVKLWLMSKRKKKAENSQTT